MKPKKEGYLRRTPVRTPGRRQYATVIYTKLEAHSEAHFE